MNLRKRRLLALTIVMTTLLLVQCAEKEGPISPLVTIPPPLYQVANMTASPQRIEPGEQATISATLLTWGDDPQPVANHEVRFGATLGTIGASDVTDANGVATAVYTASAGTGLARLTALADSASGAAVMVQVGQGSLAVNPVSILADGIATSTLLVTLVDGEGNPIPDALVVFASDKGSIAGAATRTDATGLASATLLSAASKTDVTATVTVEMTYGGATHTEVAIVQMRGVTVTVTADPAHIPADGISTSLVTAVVKETTSGMAVAGAEVEFRASLGTIAGLVIADDNGFALTPLLSSTTPGVSNVRALYGGIADSTDVTLGTLTLTLAVANSKMVADGATSQIVVATLLTETNNPVSGVVIDFTTTNGVVTRSASTNARGSAQALLTSAAFPTQAEVIASFRDVCKDTAFVDFENPIIDLRALPLAIRANPSASITMVARVVFAGGEPVPDSTKVRFTTSQGRITAIVPTISGIASAKLTPNGIADDNVTVRAACGSASASTQVVFTADVASQIICTALPDTISSGGTSFSTVIARVSDAFGNPVEDGTQVDFTIAAGHGLVTPSALTAGGAATARFTPSGGGVAIVRARCGLAQADAGIVVLAQLAGSVIADPDTAWIAVGETQDRSQAVITARVFDSYMNPVDEGTPVIFAIEYGPGGGEYLDQPAIGYGPVEKLTSGGMASVTVNAGTKPGTLLMSITAGEHVATAVTVGISAGSPDSILITTGNVVTSNDGVYVEAVSAFIRDKYNNPVENGTAVYFTLDRPDVGVINPETTTGGGFPCPEFTGTLSKGITHACLKFPTSSMTKPVTIVARCGPLESQFPTSIPIVLPVTLAVDVAPPSIVGSTGGDVAVFVRLSDGYALPIEGACIRFGLAGAGSVTPGASVTDVNGTTGAVVTIPAGTAVGKTTVKVKVCLTDVEKDVDITIQ